MNYVINVSLKGKHYFATSPHSLVSKEQAIALANEFKTFYKEDKGYEVTLAYVTQQRTTIAF